MGLDNYPQRYPCLRDDTAVLVANGSGAIDCAATQEAGGCPWLTAPDRPDAGRVYGMFGTPCWYRGKHGNALLARVGIRGEDFFGDGHERTRKSPQSCLCLADKIAAALGEKGDSLDEETREGLTYAVWYLRWAAHEAEGLNCWY